MDSASALRRGPWPTAVGEAGHAAAVVEQPDLEGGRNAAPTARRREPGSLPAHDAPWICECEISEPPRIRSLVAPGGATTARALVRLHGVPLGYVEVPMEDEPALARSVARTASRRYASAVAAHLRREGVDDADLSGPPAAGARCPELEAPGPEMITVVVCTRDRATSLQQCLQRILDSDHPNFELVVVDNAPTDDATARVVAGLAANDPRIRYTTEPHPGLSYARNRGLAEARGRYVAYTDDDVVVDRRWLSALSRAFGLEPEIGCVTGLVATAKIASHAEAYFDARAASWSSRFTPVIYDLADRALGDALYPYSAGIFGTGANFAFDRSLLLRLGGFDTALGAGSRTMGGEDLDMFVRVLQADRAVAYDPRGLVWHYHRADEASLLRQMYGYGTGFSAYITKLMLSRDTRLDVLSRIPDGLRRLWNIKKETDERLHETSSAPPRALWYELAGYAAGPFLYLRARSDARRRS